MRQVCAPHARVQKNVAHDAVTVRLCFSLRQLRGGAQDRYRFQPLRRCALGVVPGHRQQHRCHRTHRPRQQLILARVGVGFAEQQIEKNSPRPRRPQLGQQRCMYGTAPGPDADFGNALVVDGDDDDIGRCRAWRQRQTQVVPQTFRPPGPVLHHDGRGQRRQHHADQECIAGMLPAQTAEVVLRHVAVTAASRAWHHPR